jgi:16S rRNA (uracil1498-N3)-methyltransferase
MRLHRFYVTDQIGNNSEITIRDSGLYNQLKNVFRFTIGGQVILFDNSGNDYHAMIASLRDGNVVFNIIRSEENKNIPFRELHLFVSLPKKDKFEWILEKGTELGVTKFIPIVSDRSEKKSFNFDRAQKIVIESSEQAGRATLPEISEIISFEESLQNNFVCFAFDPKGDTFTIEHAQNFSPLGAYVGPEGGWTEREIFLFKKGNIKVYSLGETVLRAETAAIAVSTLLLLG